MTAFDPLDTKAWQGARDALCQLFYTREIGTDLLRAGLAGLGFTGIALELEIVLCMVLRDTTPDRPRQHRPGSRTTQILDTLKAFPSATSDEIGALCGTSGNAVRTIVRRYGKQLARAQGDRDHDRSPRVPA